MRRISHLIALPLLFALAAWGGPTACGDDAPGADADRFVAIHANEEGRVGPGAYLSTFRVTGDTCVLEVVDEVYAPDGGVDSHVCGCGGVVALGLHNDFNARNTSPQQEMWTVKRRGAWFQLGDEATTPLPLAPTPGENEYIGIHGASVQVAASGHIFYVTEVGSDYYFTDDVYYHVVRFDPRSGRVDVTDAAARDAFIAAQPETSTAYGNLWAAFSDTIYSSADGRHLYGTVRPWSYYGGMWYGAGPWYLYRYDFATDAFERLGAPEDGKDHTVIGMTRDGRHLVYRHDGQTKVLDTADLAIRTLTNAPTLSGTPRSAWTNTGVLYGGLGTFFDVMADEIVSIERPPGASTLRGAPQVSASGDAIYYLPRGDDHLYVMTRFTSEEPQVRAVCPLPDDVVGIKIIGVR